MCKGGLKGWLTTCLSASFKLVTPSAHPVEAEKAKYLYLKLFDSVIMLHNIAYLYLIYLILYGR